jgi:hypothetical protein
VQADHQQPADGGVIRQTIATFPGDGATRTFTALHALLAGCQQFSTPDGSTVGLREMAVPTVGDGSYAFALAVRAGQAAYQGYLAVGRVGTGLSVLRYLQPAGRSTDATSPAAVTRMLQCAAAKLRAPR